MASVIFYMTLLLCAVALSEGCSCAVPTIPPTAGCWKGDAFEYWNMQRFCDADFGEIFFSKFLVQIYLIDLVGLAVLYFTFHRGGAWSKNHKKFFCRQLC